MQLTTSFLWTLAVLALLYNICHGTTTEGDYSTTGMMEATTMTDAAETQTPTIAPAAETTTAGGGGGTTGAAGVLGMDTTAAAAGGAVTTATVSGGGAETTAAGGGAETTAAAAAATGGAATTIASDVVTGAGMTAGVEAGTTSAVDAGGAGGGATTTAATGAGNTVADAGTGTAGQNGQGTTAAVALTSCHQCQDCSNNPGTQNITTCDDSICVSVYNMTSKVVQRTCVSNTTEKSSCTADGEVFYSSSVHLCEFCCTGELCNKRQAETLRPLCEKEMNSDAASIYSGGFLMSLSLSVIHSMSYLV